MEFEELEFADRERIGTSCMKWDGLKAEFGEDGLLPMWVADMDIRVPKAVRETVHRLADHGVFGYCEVPDSYYKSFIDWETRRHGFTPKKEHIRFMPGIVAGLFWCVNIYTQPDDSCIILTPSYFPFINSVRNNGRKLICSELVCNNGVYSIDFDDFEKKVRDNDVKLFFLCSPHNPSSRVWTTDELTRLIEICRKYNVLVVSDEIHHDLVTGSRIHHPTATVTDYPRLITLMSASKTFNLASCQNSFAIIPDDELRGKFDDFTKKNCVYKGNKFGYAMSEAALTHGEPWLNSVLKNIRANFEYIVKTFAEKAPEITVTELEGTYLCWIDMGAYVPHEKLHEFVQEKCRLAVDYGEWFYPDETSDTHIRLNLACSPDIVREAIGIILDNLRK